jgi:ATP-dependent DNA helicase RecG
VDKYDTRTILEAMHNCIAHQDYSLNSRIIVTEKIDKLIFANAGSFFEGNPDDYSAGDKTPDKYRNTWLAKAMVNLGMIDTLGYGIHTMYLSQKNRYFPLPDYLLSESQKVVLQIYGHSIDENYSKLLIERKDLPLSNVVLLDRVQKNLSITKETATALRKDGLIEGRNPNYFVSASIAEATGQEVKYIKMRGIDDDYIQKVITDYLRKFKEDKRQDFEYVLLEKLPDKLTIEQKRTK